MASFGDAVVPQKRKRVYTPEEAARRNSREYKDQKNARARELRLLNPEIRQRERRKELRVKFGITLEDWETKLASQGHRCACCGSDNPRCKKGWIWDHNHDTGAHRGMLCWRCNVLLGQLGDTARKVQETCDMFLTYLSKHGET